MFQSSIFLSFSPLPLDPESFSECCMVVGYFLGSSSDSEHSNLLIKISWLIGSNSFLWSVNTPTSYVLSFAAFENSTVTSVRARETPTGCQSSLYWSMKSSIIK